MKFHKSIILAILAILLASAPAMAESSSNSDLYSQSATAETRFYVSGQNVRVQNGSNQMLEIYNLTGVKVASFRVDSEDKTVSLNLPKGVYIIKVGKVVRKISLR